MSFLFKKKKLHPPDVYTQGYFPCSSCGKQMPLQGLSPLEMGRCKRCKTPNFVPLRISKFWLFYPLGGGGMGAVYKAYHEDYRDDFFAVKILPRDKKEDPDLIQNLQSEADTIANLGKHPCINENARDGCNRIHFSTPSVVSLLA